MESENKCSFTVPRGINLVMVPSAQDVKRIMQWLCSIHRKATKKRFGWWTYFACWYKILCLKQENHSYNNGTCVLESFIHYVINSYTTEGYVLSSDRKTPSSMKTILQSLSTFQFATLNKRIAGICGNSTLIILVPRHHDVAFHSPLFSPGVLDQPIVLAIICTVPNNENTMVQLSAATCSASK